MTIKYPLRVFLDLSTAHLKPATREWLTTEIEHRDAFDHLFVAETPHGFFVYADQGIGKTDAEIADWCEEYEVPEDLARCMIKAIELGADYILFDADAMASDLLPVYEEEEVG